MTFAVWFRVRRVRWLPWPTKSAVVSKDTTRADAEALAKFIRLSGGDAVVLEVAPDEDGSGE